MMVLLAALGCDPKPKESGGTSGDGVPSTQEPETAAAVEYGIGDVESSIVLALTIIDDGDLGNIEIQELETTKYEVALVNAQLQKPYPEELMLNLRIRAYNNFDGHAVKIIPHFFFDEVEVELEGFIYGGTATEGLRNIQIEVFKHLKEGAPTVLIRAELELSLFLNTDVSEVTVDTPPTALTQSIPLLSNPVRIDFLP